jgi:YidC/Oxa1 family membrane protein insertase
MEKRVFLAIFLSFIVLAVYQSYFAPPPIEPVPPQPAATTTTAPGTPPPAAAGGGPPPGEPVETAPPPAPPMAAPLVADTEARDIVVDTAAVRAVFSTRGGVLTSWKLKQYLHNGEPLELVPHDVPDAEARRPFSISTDDAKVSAVLAAALYQPSATGLTLEAGPGTLTLQYRDASGLNARKTFYLQPDGHSYQVNVEVAVDVNGAALPVTIHWGPAIGLGASPGGAGLTPPRAIIHRDGDIERLSAEDLAEQPRFEGTFRFAGVEDHYFLSAAVPRDQAMRVEYRPITVPDPQTPRVFVAYSLRPVTGASPTGAAALPFYMGPKDFDKLKGVDPQLSRAIDFGMFAFLVVPLLQALKWINGYIHNYGWSIIALTVLINLAIFPLRHKSMVSMRKMQSLQPEIKAIQERYAKYKITDPERQKMNQEMMALYKQKGVNPASGCVPMLLTLPVLFAFYAMLSVAIELRGAPFLGWIHDLAAADPLYITPVLMGATMFWQQMMMPTTADPVQQKVFLLMPLIFTVMFLAAPAGLVIYWLMSNLMAIGQQYFTNKVIGPPPGAKPKVAVVKGRPGPAGARTQ